MKKELFFVRMGGMGTISCENCAFEEEIISFWHSHETDIKKAWYKSGYQCQSCGSFKTLMNDDLGSEFVPDLCSCGGKLSREFPLFCPKCKGKNLKYRMSRIT